MSQSVGYTPFRRTCLEGKTIGKPEGLVLEMTESVRFSYIFVSLGPWDSFIDNSVPFNRWLIKPDSIAGWGSQLTYRACSVESPSLVFADLRFQEKIELLTSPRKRTFNDQQSRDYFSQESQPQAGGSVFSKLTGQILSHWHWTGQSLSRHCRLSQGPQTLLTFVGQLVAGPREVPFNADLCSGQLPRRLDFQGTSLLPEMARAKER